MFEHYRQPLIPHRKFVKRMIRCCLWAGAITVFSLLIGIWGYHHFEKLSKLDSLLNASMILGGMGPVSNIYTDGGKIFASFYAIFCGAIFIFTIGLILTPLFHRFMHRFHLESTKEDKL